jgi:hypothetical protein
MESVFDRLKPLPKDGIDQKVYWTAAKGQKGKVVSAMFDGLHLIHRSWEVGPASVGCGFQCP